MSKYVIELRPDCKIVQQICEKDGQIYVDSTGVHYLDQFTVDYIKENCKSLMDAFYQKGLDDGKKAFDLLDAERDSEYQRGLDDAWECAKKLFSTMSDTEIEKIFPTEWENGFYGLMQMKPQYAIAKLKAYEEKQKADEEIKVGDLIANNTEPKLKVWVTCFDEIGFGGIAITDFGTVDEGKLYTSCSPKGWHKIGHIDIDKILEGLRYDS